MATYKITPNNSEEPYTVEADHYAYDQATGHHIFRETDENGPIVANLINVSVVRQP